MSVTCLSPAAALTFCGADGFSPVSVSVSGSKTYFVAFVPKEALNKSRHASYLHIFRLIARKLLEIHQVFLRRFHTIKRKICLRNLHTRFNQRFPKFSMNFTALSSYPPLAIAEGIPETVNVTVLPEALFTEALRPCLRSYLRQVYR